MYQIVIQKADEPVDIVQHQLCAEAITDVEMMLTAVVSKRLGVQNLVLMPLGDHRYYAFQVKNLDTLVSVEPIEGIKP
ncbi:hypothetical protein ES705_16306 [subsurface metagenome]